MSWARSGDLPSPASARMHGPASREASPQSGAPDRVEPKALEVTLAVSDILEWLPQKVEFATWLRAFGVNFQKFRKLNVFINSFFAIIR